MATTELLDKSARALVVADFQILTSRHGLTDDAAIEALARATRDFQAHLRTKAKGKASA